MHCGLLLLFTFYFINTTSSDKNTLFGTFLIKITQKEQVLGTGHKVCVLEGWRVSWWVGGGYDTNYLTFGGYETNYDICGGGGYKTKNEWNTMSMINKTTDFYNTIYI
jgi:hypothetical protein